MDERKECLVEELIPKQDHFGGVALEGEAVVGRSRKQMANPDLGREALAPATGEGAHQGGLPKPDAGFSLKGRALVREEGDKSA